MKVEIWSDVTCTHCYTAKHKFENALAQFKDNDKIDVVWKSFELAPGFKTDATKYLPEFLATLQGISLKQTTDMINHLTNVVKEVGLVYHLDKAIPANSFNAHRVSHLAKSRHLQSEAEERLFKAYFTEGQNIDDIPTLIRLATEIGLDAAEVKNMLESTRYADEVRQDIDEARQAGVTSIPYFVFNEKTSVSGARETGAYLEILEKTFSQWQLEGQKPVSVISDGQSCKIGEDCI